MRIPRQFLVVLGTGVLTAACLTAFQGGAADAAGGARSAVTAGGWGKAVTLPGGAEVGTLSCPSPGNCGAGGSRPSADGGSEAVVLSQVKGKWGGVLAVRGLTPRKGWKNASGVGAVSCTSAGNCVAVGGYAGKSSRNQAFIVIQRRGVWGPATAVPGLASLNTGNSAGLGGVSCISAGNCVATGTYSTKSASGLLFTVSEVHGTWGNAAATPVVTALSGQAAGTDAGIGGISCSSPGNCSAAGSYPIAEGNELVNQGHELFVISEVHGVWGSAIQIPGTAALNTGLSAGVNTISCSSPGNCSVGGYYFLDDDNNYYQWPFVASQVDGVWRRGIEVPGMARLGGDAWVSSISCPSDGNCSATGIYDYENTESASDSALVVNEVNGTWYRAMPVPGTLRLNQGDYAGIFPISCPTAGNCGAGGFYTVDTNVGIPYYEDFVVSEARDIWGKALQVPGTNVHNTFYSANITAISCAEPGLWCAAAGYLNSSSGVREFVVSKSIGH
jgi:hypothetical protein